jgi:D-glycero-D-manno-heptose 1,7-bisphosphate phosphatase
MRYRHLILDRDGVLNYEAPPPGYVLRPEDFHWLPGSLEALAMLHRAGVRLSVVTNQSGVGRGLMSLAALEAVNERMLADAAAAGGALDAVLCCPHAPHEGCRCRKPAPGLVTSAVEQSGVDRAETLLVGDDERDLEAAGGAGVRGVLVRSGKGRGTEARLRSRPDITVYDDLAALARELVRAA